MKTQLLSAAIASTLILSGAQTSQASDLSFAFTTLEAAQQSYTPHAASRLAKAELQSQPAAPRLLLGVYLTDVEAGLQVERTVAGSPASNALREGDIIRRISAMGQPVRILNTINQLEYAKQAIGPDRQAVLEVYRPGEGTQFIFVTLHTAGELAEMAQATTQSAALTMFEQTTDDLVTP